MSINRRMNKLWYIHTGLVFSDKKEQIMDTCGIIDKSQKQHSQQEKPGTERVPTMLFHFSVASTVIEIQMVVHLGSGDGEGRLERDLKNFCSMMSML